MASTSEKVVPGPGFYPDMAYDAYRAADALNISGLHHILHTQKKFKSEKERSSDTAATQLGRLWHSMCEDYEQFNVSHHPFPQFIGSREYANPKASKEYKEWKAQVLAENEGINFVKPEVWQTLQNMWVTLMAKPVISQYVTLEGINECSVFWEEDDVLCKARLDKILPEYKTVVDFKSTAGSASDYLRSLEKYGYDFQVAHYLAAASEAGYPCKNFIHLVTETTPPYDSAAFQLSWEDIELADQKRRRAIDIYRECCEYDIWEGHLDEVQVVERPNWARERDLKMLAQSHR